MVSGKPYPMLLSALVVNGVATSDPDICERTAKLPIANEPMPVPGPVPVLKPVAVGKEILDGWDGMLSNIVLREPSTMCRGRERLLGPVGPIVFEVG